LFVGNNNFPKQDLSFFGKLNSLRVLNLGNNNFFGSLKPLKNLLNLESLDISDTDIDDGLENLRGSKLEGIYCQVKERKNAKCQKIQKELKEYYTGNN
jgi:Leucine-rich repeat (LRR) protein